MQDNETEVPQSMVDAALRLASREWRVLPCRESGVNAKAPYTQHGFRDATTAPDVIRRWWSARPNALIGAVVPSDLIVIDVDPRHGGSVDALVAVLGPLPETLTSWSGRRDGGCHLYYRRPSGRLTSRALPVGVDLKLDTGYVIVPPSRHPVTGFAYVWQWRSPAELPARAVHVLRSRPERTTSRCATRVVDASVSTALVTQVAGALVGNRNNLLFWACCRAIDEGARTMTDLAPLIDAGHGIGLTNRRTLGYTEAEATALSALREARAAS